MQSTSTSLGRYVTPPQFRYWLVAATVKKKLKDSVCKTFDLNSFKALQQRGSVGVSPANQPYKILITKYLLNIKYVLNLKLVLGSGKIPHLPVGTPLAHIIPFRYLRAHFAECQCASPRFELK